MALTSFKPYSRVIRSSPHQTDQQQKEAYYLLHDHETQHQTEEAQIKEQVPTRRKAFCEEHSPTSKPCDLPCQEDLPTFIAHQGFARLQLQQKKGCKSDLGHATSGWIKKERYRNDQLPCPRLQKDALSQSFLQDTMSAPEAPPRIHKLRFVGRETRKQNAEQDQHKKQNKQKTSQYKNVCAIGNVYGFTHEQAATRREEFGGLEKRRSSSASVDDVIRFREVVASKERSCSGQSSWEEEVRQAMAKSLINKKQNEDYQELQKSTSMKDYETSVLPPTLLVKKTGGISSNSACLEAGSKLCETDGHPLQKVNAIEKEIWREVNVKSPSEERWEEAAEVEERQELQRRARSQSMRYDTSRSAELMAIGGPWDAHSSGNASYNDDEWAVYKKSGYVSVRPHASCGTFVAPVCCNSLLGRSLSMRDTRMGLVMECAACGAALHGAGGRLLCFCSCCAANRASATQGGIAMALKKKGGILRACRRLLGLGKKRPSTDAQI